MKFAFIDAISERFGVSRWVVWVGLAGLVIALVIVYRRRTGKSAGGSGDVLNGPFSLGDQMNSANPWPTSPDGGADTGTTPAPVATLPPLPPTSAPRKVQTVILPSDMTWGQIAQTYTGNSNNAQWVFGWNAQLHSQPWWTVSKGTKVNIPQK